MSVLMALLLAAGAAPSESVAQAREHFKSGQTHYALGEFEDAIKEFRETYRLRQEPALLFNIGQAYRQLKDWQQAYFNYRQYLSLKPDAANRSEVESFIAQMRYELDLEKEQRTRVARDPAVARNSEVVLPSAPPEPGAAATPPPAAAAAIALPASTASAAPEPAATAALPPAGTALDSAAPAPARFPPARLSGYVTLGAGGLAEVAAFFLHGSAQAAADEFNRKYAAGQLGPQDAQLKSSAQSKGRLATAAAVGGVLLLATGSVLSFAF